MAFNIHDIRGLKNEVARQTLEKEKEEYESLKESSFGNYMTAKAALFTQNIYKDSPSQSSTGLFSDQGSGGGPFKDYRTEAKRMTGLLDLKEPTLRTSTAAPKGKNNEPLAVLGRSMNRAVSSPFDILGQSLGLNIVRDIFKF